MSRETSVPSYGEWVEYVLTQAAADHKYLWDEGDFQWPKHDDPRLKQSLRYFSDFYRASPMSIWQETVYRGRLLNDSQPIVERYSAHQLAEVFDLLFVSGDEFHSNLLSIPFSMDFYSQYLDALASFYVQFLDTPVSDATDQVWCDRLHYTAFMMWDGKGPSYFPAEAQLPCLARILRECNSEDCFHCALHGLGHLAWYEEWRPACAEIIDRFLAERTVSERTREYALGARVGEGV